MLNPLIYIKIDKNYLYFRLKKYFYCLYFGLNRVLLLLLCQRENRKAECYRHSTECKYFSTLLAGFTTTNLLSLTSYTSTSNFSLISLSHNYTLSLSFHLFQIFHLFIFSLPLFPLHFHLITGHHFLRQSALFSEFSGETNATQLSETRGKALVRRKITSFLIFRRNQCDPVSRTSLRETPSPEEVHLSGFSGDPFHRK